MLWMCLVCILFFTSCHVSALDNGLGLTPPMGWLPWERFRCNTDCKHEPDNCISERLIKTQADHVAADGFKEAGYEYVIIDDCWLAEERDENRRLQSDPERFPSGIKALADHVHGKGLKFGIYEDFGTRTCGGNPGSEYYLQMDAETFAGWGVDYVKLDACHSKAKEYAEEYPPFSFHLNRTGRHIFLSCEYPFHQSKPDYPGVAKECNMARNFRDIQDSWDRVLMIINYYGDDKGNFSAVTGPGYFNDPDELILGNFGLSYEQERVQMGMWAMMASPLIMSVDLRTTRQSSKDLLLNKHVIAINQDKLGIQGTRVMQKGDFQVWTRRLDGKAVALAILYTGTDHPKMKSFQLSDLGMKHKAGYNVTEVFDQKPLGKYLPADKFSTYVNPTGIFLGKAVPL